MRPRALRRLVGAAACALAGWVATTDLFGVILYRTGDPSANTTEPTGELAGSGWQFQGQYGNFLGTPIAPQFFITAKHLGAASGTLIFQGSPYPIVKSFYDPNSDLAIWEVTGTFPTQAPLYTRGDEVGKDLVAIGRGTQRGAEITLDSTLKGWDWGAYDVQQRWGENTVAQIVALGAAFGETLYATFDAEGGFHEAHLSTGDSGGAVFIQDADGLWKLAGINFAVDSFATDAQGGGGFRAALFDVRGFHVPSASPPPPFELVAGDEPVPSGFYATRISSKLAWIYSVIDPQGDANDDGVKNLVGYALGLDPGHPAAGKMPTVEVTGSDLSLIYTRNLTATDVTYAIEQSTALSAWGGVTPVNEDLGTVGTIQTIKATVPRGTEPRLFLRLSVTRP